MLFYPESAVERAMKIPEVILRAMAKKIRWGQAAKSSASATARCGAGTSATKSLATTASMTAVWDGRARKVCPSRRSRGCLGCTGSDISI